VMMIKYKSQIGWSAALSPGPLGSCPNAKGVRERTSQPFFKTSRMGPPSRKPAPARASKGKSTHDKRSIVKAKIHKKLKIKSKYSKIDKNETPEYLKKAFEASGDATEPVKPVKPPKKAVKTGNKPSESSKTLPEKSKKPNPFAKLLAEQQKKAELRKKELEEEKMEKEANMKKRDKYYAKRKDTAAKLTAKTTRGQPIMSNHIDHLLGKIKKNPDLYQK
jgi:hypothetical protein